MKTLLTTVALALSLTACGSSSSDEVAPITPEPVPTEHCSLFTEYTHDVNAGSSDVYSITNNECNEVTEIHAYNNMLEDVSNVSNYSGEIAYYNYTGENHVDVLVVNTEDAATGIRTSTTYYFEQDGNNIGWYFVDANANATSIVEFDFTKAPYIDYHDTMQQLFNDGLTVMQEQVQLYK